MWQHQCMYYRPVKGQTIQCIQCKYLSIGYAIVRVPRFYKDLNTVLLKLGTRATRIMDVLNRSLWDYHVQIILLPANAVSAPVLVKTLIKHFDYVNNVIDWPSLSFWYQLSRFSVSEGNSKQCIGEVNGIILMPSQINILFPETKKDIYPNKITQYHLTVM